jgi:hypothetical protein
LIARTFAAIAEIAISIGVAYRVAVVPYQQNLTKRTVEREFVRLAAMSGQTTVNVAATQIARSRVQELSNEWRRSPTDVDLPMELAAEFRLLGKGGDATRTYAALLKYHRRPEIFFNLGSAQYETGDVPGAVESCANAVAFWPLWIDLTPEAIRSPVQTRARELQIALARSR